jgi:hypothetical protein
VIDSRQANLVLPLVPAGAGVLARVPTIGDHDYLLLGPAAAGAVASPLALHVTRDAPREP